jgi:predicted nicotinamide N-methyase
VIGRSLDERQRFIAANTHLAAVPYAPEIRLHVAEEATELWRKTEDELGKIGLPPPFWAFPWAGGQALARYVLDHPETVRGRRTLDFAAGSGLVAIAAAMAGASVVEACDLDPFAGAAMGLNAGANHVALTIRIEDLVGRDDGWDAVLAGDVSYERDMARNVTEWLSELAGRGALVLIGDPGRSYLQQDRLEPVAAYDIPVTRDLEDSDLKRTSVWRFR